MSDGEVVTHQFCFTQFLLLANFSGGLRIVAGINGPIFCWIQLLDSFWFDMSNLTHISATITTMWDLFITTTAANRYFCTTYVTNFDVNVHLGVNNDIVVSSLFIHRSLDRGSTSTTTTVVSLACEFRSRTYASNELDEASPFLHVSILCCIYHAHTFLPFCVSGTAPPWRRQLFGSHVGCSNGKLRSIGVQHPRWWNI